MTSDMVIWSTLHSNICNVSAIAVGPQLFGACFSYGGAPRAACAGGGTSVGVGGIGVSSTGVVGLTGTGTVGVMGLFVLVEFGIAVGTSPTGLSTFLTNVLPTSYRHSTRLLTAGI